MLFLVWRTCPLVKPAKLLDRYWFRKIVHPADQFLSLPSHLLYLGCTDRIRLSILRRLPALSTRRTLSIAVAVALFKQNRSGIPLSALEVSWFMQHGIREIYILGSLHAVLADLLPAIAWSAILLVYRNLGHA